MGRALHAKLKTSHEGWKESRDDGTFVEDVVALAEQFGKQGADNGPFKRLSREDLDLICFEYVSG